MLKAQSKVVFFRDLKGRADPTNLGTDDATNDGKSQHSTTGLLGSSQELFSSKAKALWKKLREEDAERKTNVQHVTFQEATAITGHGENGARSNAKDGKGDKRLAAAVTFF